MAKHWPLVTLVIWVSSGSAATVTWGYRGEMIQGDTGAVQAIPDSYLGPILRLRKGQKVRINLKNELDEETIIHWHGLITPPNMDGHPPDAVGPGGTYVYEFQVKNRAGTYWYHPHPHGRTGAQVNTGLAGLLLVSNTEEAAVDLPAAAYDVPLVLQVRTKTLNGDLRDTFCHWYPDMTQTTENLSLLA